MATVRDVLVGKDVRVHKVAENATVLDATRYMNEHKIGALVVMAGDAVAGIFTERDVLRRVVAEERKPCEVRVRDVMTANPICCSVALPLDEASRIMKDCRIRHVPVVDNQGAVVGMVSIGDLNAHHASEHATTVQYLQDYIHGRV